jgi:L-threonylcarbamoyladenylate synthase
MTTGGLETVAVRVPPILAAGPHPRRPRAIAAPSANRSGRPEPASAEHVREDLDGPIVLLLTAGPLRWVESTVLDRPRSPHPLRPGGVTLEQLEGCLGERRRSQSDDEEAASRFPGLRFRHYAPRAPILLIEAGTGERAVVSWLEAGKSVALMIQRATALERPQLTVKTMPADSEGYARELFSALRELDSRGVDAIFVEAIAEEGLGRTVMDRLRRAAS